MAEDGERERDCCTQPHVDLVGDHPPILPECTLEQCCRRGDHAAWEELVRSHTGLVYTVLRRCGLGDDAAAEAFHQVWLVAWQGLGTVADRPPVGIRRGPEAPGHGRMRRW